MYMYESNFVYSSEIWACLPDRAPSAPRGVRRRDAYMTLCNAIVGKSFMRRYSVVDSQDDVDDIGNKATRMSDRKKRAIRRDNPLCFNPGTPWNAAALRR